MRRNFFIILFILGFLWRLFLSEPLITDNFYDMASYSRMAKEILSGQMTTDCCDHNVGYGAWLSVVYKIFGIDNFQAVRIAQIILDLLSAWLIYLSAIKLLGKKSALYSLILYIMNPFTSSYTGLRLAEVVSIFIVSLIAYIITRNKIFSDIKLWFILGAVLGLFLFTRASSFYLIMAFLLIVNILYYLRKRNFDFTFFVILGFIIASSYTIMTNYKHYRLFSLTPPFNIGSSGLYVNFFNDRYPELLVEKDNVNGEFARILLEYHTTYYTDLSHFKNKYNGLFWERLKTDWQLFFRNTARNMVWIWDKYHLGYYYDQYYPADSFPLRVVNIFSLILFFIGMLCFVRQVRRKVMQNPLFIFTILIFASITFLFTLISNESRHSLYFYPLIYLWGGKGIEKITDLFHFA